MKEAEMKKDPDYYMFRAYDIRGIYGKDMTAEKMLKIGMALGLFLKKHKMDTKGVTVAYDIRTFSALLHHALIAGLASTGIKVSHMTKPAPFGVALFNAWKNEQDAAVFLTASHLPPEWAGVKFYYGDGVGFSKEDLMEIRDLYFTLKQNAASKDSSKLAEWHQLFNIAQVDMTEEYIKFMKDNFILEHPLKVVIDCGNGSMSLIAERLFKEVGYEIIPLYCEPDPVSPNRESEPSPESLKTLSELVQKEHADFGIGFDGDGDRALIVDDKGRVLMADILGTLLAQYLLEKGQFSEKQLVLANVECSLVIEKMLTGKVEIKRIPVGHTFLTLYAREYPNTLIGIEGSGHMVFPQFYLFDDSVLVPLLTGKMIAEKKTSLSTLVDSLPKSFTLRENVDCPDTIKFQVLEKLKEELLKEYKNVNTIDGIRIDFGPEKGWILIRVSNTSPMIRLISESLEKAEAEKMLRTFKELLVKKIEEFQK